MTDWRVEPWAMERIKRRLDTLPLLLAPARSVLLLGLPAATDIEGQLRLAGLLSLLAARGIPLAPPGALRPPHGLGAIWLGGETASLRRLQARPPVRTLLWPRPEAVPETLGLLAEWRGPPASLLLPEASALPAARLAGAEYATLLPDPAHALWGLLEHHPPGEGRLDLAKPQDWLGRLPAARLALLARLAWAPEVLRRPARARLLAAARRLVVAHAEVASPRILPGIFAALLGRAVALRAEDDATSAYWNGWAAA